VQFAMATAQANPNILDTIDWDEAIREYAEMSGIPAKIMASPEAVMAIRKAKAIAQAKAQQQQDAAVAAQGMESGAKAAKDASQAQLGNNSALDALISGITGQK